MNLDEHILKLVNEALDGNEEASNADTTNAQDTNTGSDTESTDFSASSLEEFMQKTGTQVVMTKISCEPSAIFGPNDTQNHNKYRVQIRNKNGIVWFYWWDSVVNTKNKIAAKPEDGLIALGIDAQAYNSTATIEDFIETFGYDKTEKSVAQKAFEGCKKQMERVKKMFSKEELDVLMNLAAEA